MKSNELMEQIHSGEIKDNSVIRVETEQGKYISKIKFKNKRFEWDPGEFDTKYLCDIETEFEVEEPNIDIQSIEELDIENYGSKTVVKTIEAIMKQQNQMLKWAKQLDRQINNN
jgi:hypothetical protein